MYIVILFKIASLGLPEDKAEILETYPFPDIKSVIEVSERVM